MERGIVPTSGLYQVAIIVRDLHRTAEHYQELLGIGPWQVVSIDDSMFEESTYRGRPVKHRFDLALAMSGPMQIELIQPIEGETIYAAWTTWTRPSGRSSSEALPAYRAGAPSGEAATPTWTRSGVSASSRRS
jgi:hypothetical protein